MSTETKSRESGMRLRIATLLFPPAGLLLLWTGSRSGWDRITGTLGVLGYSVLYAAAVMYVLHLFFGLQFEMRGNPVPVPTFSPTRPDYEALEAHRARHPGPDPTNASRGVVDPYWTGFRGPRRDGHYDEMPVRTNWPEEGLKALWRQPVGGGYASFSVANGRAFTIEQRRSEEAVAAYDVETGAELWVHGWTGLFQEWMGGDGPRSTPTWHEGKVYVLGALGELRCLDAATGELVWRRNLREDNRAPQLTYGFAGSPLVVDDLVVLQAGGSNGGSVVAYHRLTGEPVWKSLDDPAAYSSPMEVELAGERQLLVVTESRAVGLAVETGALLWEFPWKVLQGNRNIAQPVVLGADRFFLSAGYGTGCVAVEVARTEEGFSARETWRNTNMKNKFTSSVLWEGHLYGLDESILVCLDAGTGKRKWKDGRYGYGQLVLADGHLIILAGDGDLALVKATPERHVELARFPAIDGKTWNHPAIAGGRLFVRNSAEMACFDLAPPQGLSL